MSFYVYLITNDFNKVLYTGVTNNLERRMYEHENGNSKEKFAVKYKCSKLVYFEVYDDPENAIKREKVIKGWKRDKKDALVETKNPKWLDVKTQNYQFQSDSSSATLPQNDEKERIA